MQNPVYRKAWDKRRYDYYKKSQTYFDTEIKGLFQNLRLKSNKQRKTFAAH